MPIPSFDYLMQRTTNGFSYRADFSLTLNVAGTAGRWMDMSRAGMHPSPNLYPATNGARTWVTCDSSSGIGLPIGPTPASIESKHIFLTTMLSSISTSIPGYFILVDLQGYWPGISLTSSSLQSLSGTPTLRYENGEGCLLYQVVTTASGSTSQNLTLSYTNQAGTSGRSLPFTYTVAASTSIGLGYVNSNQPLYLPLAGNDTGVQNVASVTYSATNTTGAVALCLARPILSIPIYTLGNILEKDFVNQFPSLPRVRDNACLVWLFNPGASVVINSNFYGSVEYVWG